MENDPFSGVIDVEKVSLLDTDRASICAAIDMHRPGLWIGVEKGPR